MRVDFCYLSAGTIRVLTATEKGLSIRPLQQGERYVSISHTWGGVKRGISGINWDVASWISYQACESLVKTFENVWIDSLCIKQDDEDDKREQIKIMHDIYRKANYTVVILIGSVKTQLDALRRAKELLEGLCRMGECTASDGCPYFTAMKELRDAAVKIKSIQWFQRVWTLQEAVISEELRFAGLEDDIVITDISTEDEMYGFTHAFDLASDTESNVWLGSFVHSCIKSKIDPLSVAKDISNVADSIRPLHLQWYNSMSGKDALDTLEYTADTVFRQLDNQNRRCEKVHDLVYGVCALLGINSPADYSRPFDGVFLDAVKQLATLGICSLPPWPEQAHGKTWLPSLRHICLVDAWKTVKSACALSEESDMYHKIVCKGTDVLAKGAFVKIHKPQVICANLDEVDSKLRAIVNSVRNFGNLDLGTNEQLLAVVRTVLWMYRNRGNDRSVTERNVRNLIKGLHSGTIQLTYDEVQETVPAITRALVQDNYSESQMVRYILEACCLVTANTNVYRCLPLQGYKAVLVSKRGIGVFMYKAPLQAHTYGSYGTFSKRSLLPGKVCETSCNILELVGDDGIWDNHGQALCWYITGYRDVCNATVKVGSL
jgi:hypothetical protein